MLISVLNDSHFFLNFWLKCCCLNTVPFYLFKAFIYNCPHALAEDGRKEGFRHYLGSVLIWIFGLTTKGIPIVKIRWSHDHLIFIKQIPIPGKMVFIFRWLPGWEWLSFLMTGGYWVYFFSSPCLISQSHDFQPNGLTISLWCINHAVDNLFHVGLKWLRLLMTWACPGSDGYFPEGTCCTKGSWDWFPHMYRASNMPANHGSRLQWSYGGIS